MKKYERLSIYGHTSQQMIGAIGCTCREMAGSESLINCTFSGLSTAAVNLRFGQGKSWRSVDRSLRRIVRNQPLATTVEQAM